VLRGRINAEKALLDPKAANQRESGREISREEREREGVCEKETEREREREKRESLPLKWLLLLFSLRT